MDHVAEIVRDRRIEELTKANTSPPSRLAETPEATIGGEKRTPSSLVQFTTTMVRFVICSKSFSVRMTSRPARILSVNENLLTASTLETVVQRMGILPPQARVQPDALTDVLEREMEQGSFAIDDFNRQIYQMAIRRAEGNVALAARMLGLSRAQFAYRLGQINNAGSG